MLDGGRVREENRVQLPHILQLFTDDLDPLVQGFQVSDRIVVCTRVLRVGQSFHRVHQRSFLLLHDADELLDALLQYLRVFLDHRAGLERPEVQHNDPCHKEHASHRAEGRRGFADGKGGFPEPSFLELGEDLVVADQQGNDGRGNDELRPARSAHLVLALSDHHAHERHRHLDCEDDGRHSNRVAVSPPRGHAEEPIGRSDQGDAPREEHQEVRQVLPEQRYRAGKNPNDRRQQRQPQDIASRQACLLQQDFVAQLRHLPLPSMSGFRTGRTVRSAPHSSPVILPASVRRCQAGVLPKQGNLARLR